MFSPVADVGICVADRLWQFEKWFSKGWQRRFVRLCHVVASPKNGTGFFSESFGYGN
ncbi:MAG: hypothetical protein Q4A06_04590 [Cardiobacteriaceae bacterium]|nr:hypothetical protein [Cardiobacteriaceae bacterium]